MAFTYITSTSLGVVSSRTSSAIDTTGADLIVIACSHFDSPVPSFTDSNSNTYTLAKTQLNTTSGVSIFYCYAPTVGASHTFTVDASSQFRSFYVFAFSGAASSPLDQTNGTVGSANTASTGSVTPTEDGELVFAGLTYRDGGTVSINNGFSSPVWLNRTDDYIGGAGSYLIQTTAAAVNPQFSWPNVVGYSSAAIVTFKAAPGGGSAAGAAAHYYRQMA